MSKRIDAEMLEDFKGMKCLGRTAVSALFKFVILVLDRGALAPYPDGVPVVTAAKSLLSELAGPVIIG